MKLLINILSVIISVIFAASAFAFSDADLERYQNGGKIIRSDEPRQTDTGGRGSSSASQNSRASNSSDAQAWCTRARELDNQIRSAQIAYSQAVAGKEEANAAYNSELFSRRVGSSQAKATASSRLSETESALASARLAKRDLEEDAHRQGVPAGWLNCNF